MVPDRGIGFLDGKSVALEPRRHDGDVVGTAPLVGHRDQPGAERPADEAGGNHAVAAA